MNQKRGRPKKSEKKPFFVKLEMPFARLVETAGERKGLGKAKYFQTLIAIADKQIPNKPKAKLIIRVMPCACGT